MSDFPMRGTVIGDVSEPGSHEKLVHVRVHPQRVSNRDGERDEITVERTVTARLCQRMREAGDEVAEGHKVCVIAPLEPTSRKCVVIHRTDLPRR